MQARTTGENDAKELALVRAIQRGDAAAVGPLLTRYQDRLFGVCMRMVRDRDLAADLTQDAMIKIIEGIGSYDGRAKLSTWIIRVTMNVCISRLRSEKVRRTVSLDAPSRSAEHNPNMSGSPTAIRSRMADDREQAPGDRVEREELRRRVSAALLRVAPEHRAILVLRDCRGLEYEQIAEVLSLPVGTVKSRLFRAREALRETLELMDRPGAEGRAPDSAL